MSQGSIVYKTAFTEQFYAILENGALKKIKIKTHIQLKILTDPIKFSEMYKAKQIYGMVIPF